MIKTFSSLIVAGLIALSISGCSDKEPEVKAVEEFGCKQERFC